MPIYQYKCSTCNTEVERICNHADSLIEPAIVCDECDTPTLTRIFKNLNIASSSGRHPQRRIDDGFKEVLAKIKEVGGDRNKESTIDTNLGGM